MLRVRWLGRVRYRDAHAVQRALSEVPERQRECLLLRHSGYSYAEIAATLGIAVGSVGAVLLAVRSVFERLALLIQDLLQALLYVLEGG